MSSDLNIDLSKLTGARQTMLSWSKVVESFEDIPEVYKDSYKMALRETQSFPYTVFAPVISGEKIQRKAQGKLIAESNDNIYIWEKPGDQASLTIYPLKCISDLEVGRVLLYSWITISGVTIDGMATSTTIEFNTATSRHFAHFIDIMRPAPGRMSHSEQQEEKAKFDCLARENFKFMNYARESLVGSEAILNTILQPKISKAVIEFYGYIFYQTTLSLAHIIILTDKEIILIQDDKRSSEVRGVRYGGKWHYIPLGNIRKVSLLDHADDLLTLSLTLDPGGRQLEVNVESSKRQEIIQFQTELEKLIG